MINELGRNLLRILILGIGEVFLIIGAVLIGFNIINKIDISWDSLIFVFGGLVLRMLVEEYY